MANQNTKEFNELPYRSEFKNNWRGLGVADMVLSLIEDYPHRASGKLAYHVLDVMLSLEESAEQKKELEVKSTCERPLAMPVIKSNGKSLIFSKSLLSGLTSTAVYWDFFLSTSNKFLSLSVSTKRFDLRQFTMKPMSAGE